MSCENSSTGRKQSDKTFNFINKTTTDVRNSDKYTCNLTTQKGKVEVGPRKKISSDVYKKTTKGK